MVTYDLAVESDLTLDCKSKTSQPFITNSGDTISITCPDPDATIYYSTDASALGGNSSYPTTAVHYTAPFHVPTATLVRAAAFNPESLGSDIAWLHANPYFIIHYSTFIILCHEHPITHPRSRHRCI